jgi:hypothetical protein
MLLERTVAEVRPGKDSRPKRSTALAQHDIHVEPSGSNPASTENGSSEVIDS